MVLLILKQITLGSILSMFLSDKQQDSLYNNLLKLINIYTQYQFLETFKDHIVITFLFVLLISITLLISNEPTIRNIHPILLFIVLIWYFIEISVVQIFYAKVIQMCIRSIALCSYIALFIYNFAGSLQLKKKEIDIKNLHENINDGKYNNNDKNIIVINNILLPNEQKINKVIPQSCILNRTLKEEKKSNYINKFDSTELANKNIHRETDAMKQVREIIENKKFKNK
jgi:hypothetical protein